jgi:acid phosphatase type 7
VRPFRGLVRASSVSVATLLLIVLASVTATARSRPSSSAAATRAPLRAIIYLTGPAVGAAGPAQRPAPSASSDELGSISRHLAALEWARADAAIIPWSRPSSTADRKLTAVLAAVASSGAHVRAAALIEHLQGTEASQIGRLAAHQANAPGYLRVDSRPAVFIALADPSLRACDEVRRWRVAARGFWLAQAAFSGYASCRGAADAWFREAPEVHSARAAGTFLIRPGSWPSSAPTPALPRSADAWERSIAQMNASGAPVQIVDSLNDWAHGTAIEASDAWPSASGFGVYLDALHAHPAGAARPAARPRVGAVRLSHVTAHAAALSATVSAGTAAGAWWVEFGPTTAYGQMTSPASLAAARPPREVSAALTALSSGTTYHARVVVSSATGSVASRDAVFRTSPDPHIVRVAAAGDIACDPSSPFFNAGAGTAVDCHQRGVSDAILAGRYDAVLPLGDVQYESGSAAELSASYDPSWGRLKPITHPAVGNHEYGSPGAEAYFHYFGVAAGAPDRGYYSYDLGSWHLIVLNSNCARIGGCVAGSAEEAWLRADLAAHPVACIVAYWHHPRFSSGQNGDAEFMGTIWSDLYAAGADVVLNGHDHDYERFAPQTPAGSRDDARGIREFVVGTGGKNHMRFKSIEANSEVHDNTSFGFLELTLRAGAYDWRFVSDPPGGLSDSGAGTCH